MLEIKALSLSYPQKREDKPALCDISFEIQNGEVYALLGPSGCGKSTLLHVLAGLLPPSSGEILLEGSPLSVKSHTIGFVPQNCGLLPWKTVWQNLTLPTKIKKQPKADTSITLTYLVDRLGIKDLLHSYPTRLSGGQKQRVALARAFSLSSDLLLMDEPFSALDTLNREEAAKLFLENWNIYKTTTLFVTHYIDEALYMGQKIIVLGGSPGQVLEIIDNPFFSQLDAKGTADYFKLSEHIRSLVKQGGLL